MRPVTIAKFLGAWGCIIGACVVILIGHELPVIAVTLATLGIAFGVAPTAW